MPMKTGEILRELANPAARYRPLPFWFWNGEMTEREIDRQLCEMAAQGLGGVFISPRQGMNVPYLSQAYFDLFRHAALTAHGLGMSAWIYDEFPYPSGVSGGEVLMRWPELRQTRLEHVRVESGGGPCCLSLGRGVVLDAKAVPLDAENRADWAKALDLLPCVGVSPRETVFQEDSGLTCYNAKRFFTHAPQMRLWTELPAGLWRVEACVQREIEDFKYYGGFIDPCDPRAADAFLQTTHERYARAMGDLFGSVIQGVFTDETGLLGKIPWSKRLPEEYKNRYGEALDGRLCEMLDAGAPGAAALRSRVYDTLHHMLREGYHRPISRWCHAHGLQYVAEVPGMRMTTQLYSDVVGGDFNHEKLGLPLDTIHDLHTTNYRHNPTAIASLARQTGRERALVESFHSVGWTMTLQDAKWGLDYLIACGINLFNFHAFFYSTEGLRKYDAPPSQFCQNPYWPHYRLFADFAARAALIGANTSATAEVAILEPTSSLWSLLTNPFEDYEYGGEDDGEAERHESLRNVWKWTRRALFHGQISFDHLDPELLAGKPCEAGRVRVGGAAYHVLILTACTVLERETYEALCRFTRCGGVLLTVGETPKSLTDGQRLPALPQNTLALRADDERTLVETVLRHSDAAIRFAVCASDSAVCMSHLRKAESGEPWLFVANQQGKPVTGELLLATPWKAAKKICCDGRPDGTLNADASGRAPLRLEPYESAWFVGQKEPLAAESRPPVLRVALDQTLPYLLAGPNWLRMERCEVSTDERQWTESAVKPYSLQREAMGTLGREDWEMTDGFGLPKRIRFRYPRAFSLRMRFDAECLPADAELALEKDALLGEGQAFLNGCPLTAWREENEQGVRYRACPVAREMRLGENTLLFRLNVANDWEGLVDAVAIRGAFSVETGGEKPRITKQKGRARFSTAYPEGAPHYSGKVTWECPFEATCPEGVAELELATAEPLVDCIELRLNGVPLGARAFAPYRWSVPENAVREGQNLLCVEISNTLAHRYEGRCFDYAHHRLRDA